MDIAFTNPTGGGFDFAHDGTDLIVGDALVTMLIHALFRDARASQDVIQAGEDPRGHWSTDLSNGTIVAEGSFLWLIRREKITPDMPHRIVQVLERACEPMVAATEGPAAPVVKVRATANRAPVRGRIDAQLSLFLDAGRDPRRFKIVYDFTNEKYELEELA